MKSSRIIVSALLLIIALLGAACGGSYSPTAPAISDADIEQVEAGGGVAPPGNCDGDRQGEQTVFDCE